MATYYPPHGDPSVSAEIVYNTARREVAFATLRLGPLDDGDHLQWENLVPNDFKPAAVLLEPICTKKFYYKLEMARQITYENQNADWVFDELRGPLKQASQLADSFQPSPLPTLDASFERMSIVKRRQHFAVSSSPLNAQKPAGRAISFKETCDTFVASLDDFQAQLKNDELDDDDTNLMEQKWRLETLLRFYKNVVPRTQHPVDLKVVVDTMDDYESYSYYNGYHTDYCNRRDRNQANYCLRLDKPNSDSD